MAREKAPAFQFYPRDWLSDPTQAAMSPAAAGAYIRLLCYCWLDHVLPTTEAVLARLAGMSLREWGRIAAEVLPAFASDGQCYRHRRLDLERQKQADWEALSRRGGEASAKARRQRFGSAQPGTHPEPASEATTEPRGSPPGSQMVDDAPEPFPNSSSSSSSSSSERKRGRASLALLIGVPPAGAKRCSSVRAAG